MKIRIGFVSNSSSASFVVAVSVLTGEQLRQILGFEGDGWSFRVEEGALHGRTSMDNGALDDFLETIGVNQTRIRLEKD